MEGAKRKSGLRWSPKPLKHYTQAPSAGSALRCRERDLRLQPGVWNLFWVCAADIERSPLSDEQVEALYAAAAKTSVQCVRGTPAGDLTLRLMPDDFAALLEANPVQAKRLSLTQMFREHFVGLILERGELFYVDRRTEDGRIVSAPISQGETIRLDSTNIMTFLKFKDRPFH